jgi:F0F1-type ATP synthase assembly protein I
MSLLKQWKALRIMRRLFRPASASAAGISSLDRRCVSTNVLAAAARQSLRLASWQALWSAVLAAIFALALGERAAWSVLAGGGIGLVWTLYMALVLFKQGLTHGVALSPLSLLAGWLFKVVATIGLLVIAFRSRAFAPLPLLAGLFGAMVAYWAWFALWMRNAGEADGK